MKKIMVTVALLALLTKVKNEVGFNSEKINDFIDENEGKEGFNEEELELDENDLNDLVDSLERFNGDTEDNTAAEEWLNELTEPVAEEVAETAAEEVTEPVVEAATEETVAEEVTEPLAEPAAEPIIEPGAEENGKQE